MLSKSVARNKGEIMGISADYMQYACEQIRSTGNVTSRFMFGGGMVYVNGKPIILITDNVCYVKIHDCIKDILGDADIAEPYSGAKLAYVLDIDNRELSIAVVKRLLEVIPLPKSKVKNKAKAEYLKK